MHAGREQGPGQVLRTGGCDAGGSPAARPRAGPRRVLVAALVLAMLAVALPGLLLREPDPAGVAREYLDALVDGDLATVRGHLDPVTGALDIALTPEIRAATDDGLTGYTIDEVTVQGSRAEVLASLHSPGARHTARLTLSAHPEGLLRTPRWELDPVTLPVLQINPLSSTHVLLLNGQALQVPPLRRTGEDADHRELLLHVLPGRYTIALPPATGPFVPRTGEVLVPPVVGPWRTGTLVLDYSLTRFSDSQARGAILGALADCARSTSPQPADCPFGLDLPTGTTGTWRLVTSPEISYVTLRGNDVEYRGTGLVAEFTEAGPDQAMSPADGREPARSGTTGVLEGTRASLGDGGQGTSDAPRVHRATIDFAVSLRRVPTGFRIEDWGYTSQRIWPA